MSFLMRWKIDRLIRKQVLPKLAEAPVGTDEFIIDENSIRIRIIVDQNMNRKFVVHTKTNGGKSWNYTTYNANSAIPAPMYSGSYPGDWKQKGNKKE